MANPVGWAFNGGQLIGNVISVTKAEPNQRAPEKQEGRHHGHAAYLLRSSKDSIAR